MCVWCGSFVWVALQFLNYVPTNGVASQYKGVSENKEHGKGKYNK